MKPVSALSLCLSIYAVGCGSNTTDNPGGPLGAGGSAPTGGMRSTTGGATATGGSAAGGVVSTGGMATGGSSTTAGQSSGGSPVGTGGTPAAGAGAGGQTGGVSAGGSVTGGSTSGGKSGTGGSNDGGRASGGRSNSGGSNAGGSSSGGQPTGGTSGSGGASTGGQAGASNGGGSQMSAGCGKAPSIPSSQFNNGTPISISVGGTQRRYVINVPTNYDNSRPYKLILTLHQLDGNDKQMHNWQYYGLLPLAKDEAIFVAPNGQKNNAPCSGTGNGESGCGWPNPNGQDIALLDAVVAQIEQNFCIDKSRILATGWSYGGSMSYQTACERPLGGTAASWGVRAIAVYSAAQLSGRCTPSKPVAYFHAHGTHDSVLNYDNQGMPLAQNFAKANGCTWATPTKVTSGAHVCTNLMGCQSGYPLEFCSFNGDHTPFPDNGQSQGSWGPQEAWKFLSQF